MAQVDETQFARLENRVAQVERRVDREEKRHDEYVSWAIKFDARLTSLSNLVGSKFAELMGLIDSVSRRTKTRSLPQYLPDDSDEITGVNDPESLRAKAREQREIIRHARKLTRLLTVLIPAVAAAGAAVGELLRWLGR